MTICPVGAELFHADRRTDMRLIVAFCSFANAPNNGALYDIYVHMRMGNAKNRAYQRVRLCKQVHNTGDKKIFSTAQKAIILEGKVIEQ
jgi:hypothetical protein